MISVSRVWLAWSGMVYNVIGPRRRMENTDGVSSKTAIQAVIFDYGNVLSRPQTSSDLNAMAEGCGMPIGRFFDSYWKFRLAYDRGELKGPSFWTSVTAEVGKTPTPDKISELVSLDVQSWLHINQATMTWAVQLRRAGIRLALLSNMPFEIARYIESNCPWVSYFDPLIFSCDLGSVKPELTIYKNCLARLNVLPDKVLFLDDRAENVAAATQLGIPGLVFDDMGKVSREVERLFDLPVSSETEVSATHK
jgi:putative hydrolase of the HAD superfamily